MNLIYNEVEVLDKLLNEGKCDIKKDLLINILIKYYYANGIENKLDIREKILETLYKIDSTATRNVWTGCTQGKIERIVSAIKKGDVPLELFEVSDVDIYEEELNIIESSGQVRYKKFLFILLVWAKVYKKCCRTVIKEEPSFLLKKSKCKSGNDDYRMDLLGELRELGFIEANYINDKCNIKINYLKEEGEVAFTVDDIENAIYYYLNWSGEKWIKCQGENCGKYFKIPKKIGKNPIYCKECARKMELMKTNERVKKYIKKEKNIKN